MSADEPRPPVRPPAPEPPRAELLLRRVADMIASARPMPLSTSVMVNRDEVLELLEEGINRLPDELRAARWLLKERDEYLASVRREGDEILEAARARAESMVQRTEVVKAAEHRARQLVDRAEAQARTMRLEVEDYCDQRLASFEIVLERVGRSVAEGRARLQGPGSSAVAGREDPETDRGVGPDTAPSASRVESGGPPAERREDDGLFDQDLG